MSVVCASVSVVCASVSVVCASVSVVCASVSVVCASVSTAPMVLLGATCIEFLCRSLLMYIGRRRVSNPKSGILACDAKPRKENPDWDSPNFCSRSAKWVWDRPVCGTLPSSPGPVPILLSANRNLENPKPGIESLALDHKPTSPALDSKHAMIFFCCDPVWCVRLYVLSQWCVVDSYVGRR